MNPQETIKCHCNKCLQSTKHFIVATRTHVDSGETDPRGYSVSWTDTYQMLECCGCGTPVVKRVSWLSEWDHGDEEVQFYPPATSRRLPTWSDQLRPGLKELLVETYSALQADSLRLAMMGARALIDSVIFDTVGDLGTFDVKLRALETQGYLSTKNRKTLDAALEVGNAAAHRGHKASDTEANLVMDIVENLLQQRLLDPAAAQLRGSTPTRPKPPQAT